MRKTLYNPKYKVLLAELKKARKKAGFTQRDVAKRISKHPPFVYKMESGERRIDVFELSILCRLYGIKVSTLLKSVGLN